MEMAVLSDPFQLLSKHALSSNHLSVASASGNLQISALLSAIDAIASPPVRSPPSPRAAARTLRKRRLCRTRKRRRSSGGTDEDGYLGGGGDDGPIGGGGGGGWNFDGFGEFGWDDSSSSPADPAFDFVYEVLCWLVLSNCLHFAYKKVVRLVADHGREKVPMRMASVC